VPSEESGVKIHKYVDVEPAEQAVYVFDPEHEAQDPDRVRAQSRGSTGSLSSASTPNTHSCTR
jgi:hypothetical protein